MNVAKITINFFKYLYGKILEVVAGEFKGIMIPLIFVMGYVGIDGIIGKQSMSVIDVEDVYKEDFNMKSERFFTIKNCHTFEMYIYEYFEREPEKVQSLIFPIYSERGFLNILSDTVSHPPTAKIFVKRELDEYNKNCLENENCLEDLVSQSLYKGFTLKGRVQKGIFALSNEDIELFNSMNVIVDENPILLIENDVKQRSQILSYFLILVASVLSVVYIKFTFMDKKQ